MRSLQSSLHGNPRARGSSANPRDSRVVLLFIESSASKIYEARDLFQRVRHLKSAKGARFACFFIFIPLALNFFFLSSPTCRDVHDRVGYKGPRRRAKVTREHAPRPHR